MKVIVEKMSEVDSRIKMLLLVAFAYFGLSFGFNHVEAMTTLENYTPAINVMIKDGTNEVVGQLVKQSTAKNIIEDLKENNLTYHLSYNENNINIINYNVL